MITDLRSPDRVGVELELVRLSRDDLLEPLTERALRAKYEEYMPFGLLPIFANET